MRTAGNEIYSADQVEAGQLMELTLSLMSSFILIDILMYLMIVVGSLFSGIFLTESEIESYEESNSLFHKFYSPVLMSDLKFAAYGHKFLNNYIKNISIYIRQLKIAQIDNNHDEK